MRWRNPLEDPIPALVLDAWLHAIMSDRGPCTACNENFQKIKEGAEVIHFHASNVGGCGRKTQYSMMYPLKAMGASKPEFLKDGHLHEAGILELIRVGFSDPKAIDESIESVSVYAAKNDEELFQRLPYKDASGALCEFVIVGHWDGLMSIGYTDGRFEEYLLECKAVKDFTFQKVKAGEISSEWYGQIQTYLSMLGLKTAYLLVKNRTTSEVLPPIRIDFNPKYIEGRRQKLAEIHEEMMSDNRGLVDREHTSPKNDECLFCRFKTKCWGERLDKKEKRNGTYSKKPKSRSSKTSGKEKRKVEKANLPVLPTKTRRTRNGPSRKG